MNFSRPLTPLNPLDQARLLHWVFFAPDRLTSEIAARPEAVRHTGAWLLGALVFLPLLIPALAVSAGVLPAPQMMSPGFLPFLLLCLIAGWLITGLRGDGEWVGEELTDTQAKRTQFIPAGILGLALLPGMIFTIALALDGSLARAILLLAALALAFYIAAAIGTIVAPDRIARAASYLALLSGGIALAFQLTLNSGAALNGAITAALRLDRAAGELSSVCVFFGLPIFLTIGAWRLNQRAVQAVQLVLERKYSPRAAQGIAIIFAAAYIDLLWICLFGGWRF